MNWREKYSFWVDRTVNGYVYRFSEYEIKRHAVGGPEHFLVWNDFETQAECRRAWRELCDKAADEQNKNKETP